MDDPARQQWLRRQSCCASQPACTTCPLLPGNARKSLRQLAQEALAQGQRGPA